MKKLIVSSFLLLIVSLVMLTGCDNRLTYVIDKETPPEIKPDSVKINLYLETSFSMKGYVRSSNSKADHKLKEVVPFIISEIERNYKKVDLFTITDEPHEYPGTHDEFNANLRNGNLISGGTTQLHNIFERLIDSSDNSGKLNILISDCILDLGRGGDENMLNRGIMTTDIYRPLNKKNISAAVFKYTSDFEGTYYYDRKNTKPSPYSGDVLHERPFYIWLIGDRELIKEFYTKNIINNSNYNYDESFIYNVSYNDITRVILKYPIGGHVSILENGASFSAKDYDDHNPKITIGLNLSTLPEFAQKMEYFKNNLIVSPENLEVETNVLNKESIKSTKNYSKIASNIAKKKLTHFIELSFKNLKSTDSSFQIILKKPDQATWISETNLNDDYNNPPLPLDSLENRTFSFIYLTDAFKLRYEDENLFEITFNLKIN